MPGRYHLQDDLASPFPSVQPQRSSNHRYSSASQVSICLVRGCTNIVLRSDLVCN
ncbi:hypothetical protein HETIRDRAFT_171264 [Heterobasidion irregulare TC 32-1]|uniref:Uncharacterized protein n=1 Tax=Heterobasidion irregulare (strain TC 32-1) TaxID=747525 RepID=W4KGD0_HETIT|nr:uncharacterized protein HETIRDRAFT_171264 [Heterobasidion irregulare TC 32-1]ETW84769.1 hypothetical protein HETIRDRAFT_171264 [Heterobasidion irregulare TC 32-1]